MHGSVKNHFYPVDKMAPNTSLVTRADRAETFSFNQIVTILSALYKPDMHMQQRPSAAPLIRT